MSELIERAFAAVPPELWAGERLDFAAAVRGDLIPPEPNGPRLYVGDTIAHARALRIREAREREARVVALHDDGLTWEQIAAALSVDRRTVQRAYQRAKGAANAAD